MLAPLPVGSVTVLACRDTLAAVMATRFSGSFPSDPDAGPSAGPHSIAVDGAALPRGVSMLSTETLPSFVVEVLALDLDELHHRAVAQAWRDGAWDIAVTLHGRLDGSSLGIVDAHRDWDVSAGPIRRQLLDAARRGRLATWLHKPMHNGPEIRVMAHARKDATLAPDHSRGGLPPVLRRPDWAWGSGRQWLIRLGGPGAGRARPATPPQLRYIALLRRQLGLRGPIGTLGLSEASRMIDDLRAALLRSTPDGDEEMLA